MIRLTFPRSICLLWKQEPQLRVLEVPKDKMNNNHNSRVGQYAAIAVAAETVLFGISLIIGLAISPAFGSIMGYIVCIFLAASIVVMMASFYLRAEGYRKIYSLLAMIAAAIYAPFCIGTYYIQLAIVTTNPLAHPPEVLKLITFVPGSTAFALDMLGYTFLCLSTLAAAFAIIDQRDKALRILCIIHGAIAIPTVAGPILSNIYRSNSGNANNTGSWVLLFWCVLFTPIPILFRRLFAKDVLKRKT